MEFTIALPICLLMLMAVAEFGRAFMQYHTLTKGVRDGVRLVAGKALKGSTGTITIDATLQAQTKNVVVYGNVLGAGAPILPGLSPANVTVASAGLQDVTVTASYPYNSIFAFIPRFMYGGNVDTSAYVFQAAVTMRAL